MALITCPECSRKISDDAYSCPGCGRPQRDPPLQVVSVGASCPICRTLAVKGTGLHGGSEVAAAIVLVFFGILPAIIYYVFKDAQPYCYTCKVRV